MKKSLHVISFDNPFPANYGGAIDVYYKLKALKNAGCHIILHVFQYGDMREQRENLSKVADEIYYYRRKTGICSNFNLLPYIVYSRRSKELLKNLLKDNYPILFEGLHSCYLLQNPALKNRLKLVRSHNVEHQYYHFLYETATSIWKKLYYRVEEYRLKRYEKTLMCADEIFAISTSDKQYFQTQFPELKIELLPCFFDGDESQKSIPHKSSDYFLYHGNLEVAENQKAVLYLLKQVVPLTNTSIKWKIAGKNPPKKIREIVMLNKQVELIVNPNDYELNQLIANARANVLITFQPTGIKLKLLNALYKGGFCIVNKMMLTGTDLEDLCLIADTPRDIANLINSVSIIEFNQKDKNFRLQKLSKKYSNILNTKIILDNLEDEL